MLRSPLLRTVRAALGWGRPVRQWAVRTQGEIRASLSPRGGAHPPRAGGPGSLGWGHRRAALAHGMARRLRVRDRAGQATDGYD
ncbi:MAG: hypothetical protein WC683_01380 [bacterium]